jgi:hypothetical protein
MTGKCSTRPGLSHRGGGAYPKPLRGDLDANLEQASEADQPLGPTHVFLQQLDHIGAAGDVFRRGIGAAGLCAKVKGGSQVARAFEGEGVHGSASLCGIRRASRVLDGRDNVVVRAATAQVAAHPVADLLRRSSVALGNAGDAGHDLTGRAIAALEGVALDKGGLQRMKLLALRQAFNGLDLAPIDQRGEREARLHALSIDEDRAGSALPEVTAFLRASELQVFAQGIEQGGARIERQLVFGTIHAQDNGNRWDRGVGLRGRHFGLLRGS